MPPSTPCAMPTGITSWRSGKPAASASTPRASASAEGGNATRLVDLPGRFGILGKTLELAAGRDRTGRAPMPGILLDGRASDPLAVFPDGRPELAVSIPGSREPWGVLHVVGETAGSLGPRDLEVARVAADALGAMVSGAQRADEVAHLLHRAEALRRVATDIGSRLDLDRILSGLVDHAMVLFEGDRAAVFLQHPDGHVSAEVTRNLSAAFVASVRDFPERSLPAAAVAALQPLFAVDYRNDPRGEDVRAAVVQEGFDTLCTAPLMDGTHLLGLLNIYHDRPHHWTTDELDTIGALATQASVAIQAAQDFERMATWAAQLQSIQQLGTRLNRLSSVAEIGQSIATELRQLIDYHNARVYRLVGDELVPVAMQGQVGEYVDETPDQLRVALGEGITGWVAAHRVAQILGDAAADPRADTIPGTEDDLDESMLLAPMVFDDQVLGVLVLSKLGLNKFTDDDLRLLVIYASFAAQAMANADTTERLREQTLALEQQLRGQRELLQITESILTTLDARGVLESITDRLGAADRLRQRRHRGRRSVDRPADAADRARGPRRVLPRAVGARRDRRRDVGRRAQRAGLHHRRAERPAGQPFPRGHRLDRRQPHRRPAARPGRRDRRPDHRAARRSATPSRPRSSSSSSCSRRRCRSRSRTPRSSRRSRSGPGPTTSPGCSTTARSRSGSSGASATGAVQPDHARPRRLPERQQRPRPPGRRRAAATDRRRAWSGPAATRTSSSATAATSSPSCCRIPTRPAPSRSPSVRGSPWPPTDGTVTASVGVATFPTDGATATDVLLAADRACYVAKRGGRDRIVTAAEGLALAAELSLQPPTPVDSAAPPPAA